MTSSFQTGVPGTPVMPVPQVARAACQMPNDGARRVGGDRQPARVARVQRADADRAAAVPDRLRRRVRVVRGEVRRPGDGQMAVRRQLADAGHLLAVEQRPVRTGRAAGGRAGTPSRTAPRRTPGSRPARAPSGSPSRVCRACARYRSGRSTPCLGHRHSLLGPSWWPCRFRSGRAYRCRVRSRPVPMLAPPVVPRPAPPADAPREDARFAGSIRFRAIAGGVHRLYSMCPSPYAA